MSEELTHTTDNATTIRPFMLDVCNVGNAEGYVVPDARLVMTPAIRTSELLSACRPRSCRRCSLC